MLAYLKFQVSHNVEGSFPGQIWNYSLCLSYNHNQSYILDFFCNDLSSNLCWFSINKTASFGLNPMSVCKTHVTYILNYYYLNCRSKIISLSIRHKTKRIFNKMIKANIQSTCWFHHPKIKLCCFVLTSLMGNFESLDFGLWN